MDSPVTLKHGQSRKNHIYIMIGSRSNSSSKSPNQGKFRIVRTYLLPLSSTHSRTRRSSHPPLLTIFRPLSVCFPHLPSPLVSSSSSSFPFLNPLSSMPRHMVHQSSSAFAGVPFVCLCICSSGSRSSSSCLQRCQCSAVRSC